MRSPIGTVMLFCPDCDHDFNSPEGRARIMEEKVSRLTIGKPRA